MGEQQPAPSPDDVVIPRIVSVDDHVVEPPDIWSSRLPAKYVDIGPRVELLPMGTAPKLVGAAYVEEPGTEGPPIAWWFYEDQRASVKRFIAAAGYPPEEIGPHGVTFDDMRPGCWQPKAAPRGHGPQPRRGLAVLPELPALLRSDLPARQGQGALQAVRRGLQRLDGRRVVR